MEEEEETSLSRSRGSLPSGDLATRVTNNQPPLAPPSSLSAQLASNGGDETTTTFPKSQQHHSYRRIIFFVIVLTYVNFINWVDRGIIAGAATDIKGCLASELECSRKNRQRPALRCPSPDDHHNSDDDDDDYCSTTCVVCSATSPCPRERKQTGFGITDYKLGLAQSCFMIGYLIGSIHFAVRSKHLTVFSLLARGMSVWMIGVLLSGLSGHLDALWMLVAGRALSGVGEAALATVALPFLDDVCPPSTKGRYISIYSAAIPLGTACGFVYAGRVSDVDRWETAFLAELPAMLPFVLGCFIMRPPYRLSIHHPATSHRPPIPSALGIASNPKRTNELNDDDVDEGYESFVERGDVDYSNASSNLSSHSNAIRIAIEGERGGEVTVVSIARGHSTDDFNDPSFFYRSQEEDYDLEGESSRRARCRARLGRLRGLIQRELILLKIEILACLERPVFDLTAVGLAAFTYTTAGLAFYMPQFLQNYRPNCSWNFTQSQADQAFGVMVVTAGFLGTVAGGTMMDRFGKGKRTESINATTGEIEYVQEEQDEDRLSVGLRLAVALISGAAVLLLVATFVERLPVFLFLSWVGVILAFCTTTPITFCLLGSVPERNRSMAMAVSVVLVHLLGDVPSPTLIGYVSDSRGPKPALYVAWLGLPFCAMIWEWARRRRVMETVVV